MKPQSMTVSSEQGRRHGNTAGTGAAMKHVLSVTARLSTLMFWIAALALVSIVFLTVFDVFFRKIGTPIDWIFEVVVLLGAVAIGFSLPQTAFDKGHVRMDLLMVILPPTWQKGFNIITRFLGIVVFALFGWRSFPYGTNLWESGQVSANLHLPEFPVAYGLGVCCFIVCLILSRELVREIRS